MSGLTLLEKLWQRHVVREEAAGRALLYIDRLLVYEVTSPQAFEGMRLSGRRPWRRRSVLATCDHNVPTTSRALDIGFGVGTTDVEHVLATQCLSVDRMQPMLVRVNGALPKGLSA
jgi:3-isopropylmalate/(R)-2-methylmalate dehydratase large subunit